jgi:hypothetical protein
MTRLALFLSCCVRDRGSRTCDFLGENRIENLSFLYLFLPPHIDFFFKAGNATWRWLSTAYAWESKSMALRFLADCCGSGSGVVEVGGGGGVLTDNMPQWV